MNSFLKLYMTLLLFSLIVLNSCTKDNPNSTNDDNSTNDTSSYEVELYLLDIEFSNGILIKNDTITTVNIDTILNIEDDAIISYTIFENNVVCTLANDMNITTVPGGFPIYKNDNMQSTFTADSVYFFWNWEGSIDSHFIVTNSNNRPVDTILNYTEMPGALEGSFYEDYCSMITLENCSIDSFTKSHDTSNTFIFPYELTDYGFVTKTSRVYINNGVYAVGFSINPDSIDAIYNTYSNIDTLQKYLEVGITIIEWRYIKTSN